MKASITTVGQLQIGDSFKLPGGTLEWRVIRKDLDQVHSVALWRGQPIKDRIGSLLDGYPHSFPVTQIEKEKAA